VSLAFSTSEPFCSVTTIRTCSGLARSAHFHEFIISFLLVTAGNSAGTPDAIRAAPLRHRVMRYFLIGKLGPLTVSPSLNTGCAQLETTARPPIAAPRTLPIARLLGLSTRVTAVALTAITLRAQTHLRTATSTRTRHYPIRILSSPLHPRPHPPFVGLRAPHDAW
jgi:hypothetical protein